MHKRNWITLIEAGVVLIIVFIVDIALLNGEGLSINPTPYLFVSAIFSGFYGTIWGFSLAAGMMLLNVFFINSLDWLSHPENIWKGISVLLIAVVIGLIRDILDEKIKNRDHAIQLRDEEIADLKEENVNLNDIGNEITKRLYFETESMGYIMHRLNDFSEIDSEKIISNAIALLSELTEAKGLSLYFASKDNAYIRKLLFKGDSLLPNSLKTESSVMFQEASKNGLAVINDEIIEHITQMEPWIVCRINNELDDTIYGYIVVEAIEYEKLNENNFQYIRLVSRWLEVNLRNAWNYEREYERENINPDGTWKMDTQKRILDIEKERFEKYGIPFQRLSIESKTDIGEDTMGMIRSFDYLFKGMTDGIHNYVLILTNTTKDGRESVYSRLNEKIPQFQSYVKGMESFEK
ncbi:MAG TPA: hypothetical protein P5107_12595 [Thermotogota bacterium]|nr:hypothetical protein [Thermotogota bacterium]